MESLCLKQITRKPVVTTAICLFMVIFILLHYHISSPSGDGRVQRAEYDQMRSSSPIRAYLGRNSEDAEEHQSQLLKRIKYLLNTKLSLSNEIRIIQKKKSRLIQDINDLVNKNEQVLNSINKNKLRLRQLELDVISTRKRRYEDNCDIGRIAPIVFRPLDSIELDELLLDNITLERYQRANSKLELKSDLKSDLNMSRCSLTEQFSFYLDPIENAGLNNSLISAELELARDFFLRHEQYTSKIDEACIIIKILDAERWPPTHFDPTRNYLLISLDSREQIDPKIRPRNSIVASPVFHPGQYVNKLDIFIPSVIKSSSAFESIIGSIPPSSPIQRKYLASYLGVSTRTMVDKGLSQAEKVLQAIHRNSIDDLFLFLYECDAKSKPDCYSQREKLTELSVFSIILVSSGIDKAENFHQGLYVALSKGTIPVLIMSRSATSKLPFHEVLDWTKALIIITPGRLPELHFILRTISALDLYRYKYYGRYYFESYLATCSQVFATIMSIVSMERFNYPPQAALDAETKLYRTPEELVYDSNCSHGACVDAQNDSSTLMLTDELLGPREQPLASPKFRHNFTMVLSQRYDLWNDPMYSPHELYSSYPRYLVAPSEFKFLNSEQAYRPIGNGLGGSGNEFSRALGGDYPNEQFTIVLLTYNRNNMLMRTLERLKRMPYLNKVLVVWNGIRSPPDDSLVWPDVGVPLELVKVERNSLNNRFIPYDTIQTDAILSLDDDSPLRPDEIVFAFRVWRQSRDQIVGFPGRYHAWDRERESWMYNSNHSCELSMVLTGGAFFHKYYSYLYSYKMAHSIRDIVDKYMNCEDIAMNFLVAHLTRKPPIKVTSRWTFHCAGCASSLSEDDSHFTERHECLNLFASIYGYMPLLSTQHRSDSVLFKTRIPSDKQKCYKFV